MNIIRISGAIASKSGITLYLEDGNEMNLPNDTWRTKAIMEMVVVPVANGAVVEVDLDKFSVTQQIEDKTAGVIRFIHKTMETLQEMLTELEGETKVEVGVNFGTVSARLSEPEPKTELVAVVDGVEIGGMDMLEKHLDHAAFTGNTKGLEKFMKRIAAVSKTKSHTVQELLNFMSKGDLPIADDGSIVAYKVLSKVDDHFVDCYTHKVQQRLGSRVSMDPKLIDQDRRHECSTGLHIARRGYLGNFSGDVITLVKIAPEDVVAVPPGEPNKMRVAAYHIVGVLPTEVAAILRSNKPMTSNSDAAKLLADVIAGNHVKVTETVRIGEAKGEKVRNRTLKASTQPAPKANQHGEAKAMDDNKGMTPKDIRDIARKGKDAAMAALADAFETKAERDARKKREKRAAQKAASEQQNKHVVPDTPLAIYRKIDGETKRDRDARIKREKNRAARANKG